MLAGRLLFGAFFAFNGLNHFMKKDMMSGYAESKGVPSPEISVLLSGLLLLVGGTSIAIGAYPVVGALMVIAFLVATTPVMHDFWAVEEDQKTDELTSFMKNTALLGGAFVFLSVVLAGNEIIYSLGLSLL